jgi:hypothetical protein
MTHSLLLMAIRHPKHQFMEGAKDGLLLIPRAVERLAGHHNQLVYHHASLFYYITLIVFVALEVLAVRVLAGMLRR